MAEHIRIIFFSLYLWKSSKCAWKFLEFISYSRLMVTKCWLLTLLMAGVPFSHRKVQTEAYEKTATIVSDPYLIKLNQWLIEKWGFFTFEWEVCFIIIFYNYEIRNTYCRLPEAIYRPPNNFWIWTRYLAGHHDTSLFWYYTCLGGDEWFQ